MEGWDAPLSPRSYPAAKQKITEKQLDKNEFYARYAGFGEDRLLSAIDTLVLEGLLRVSSGMYPKLFLTADGRIKITIV